MRKKIGVIGKGVQIAHDLARHADVGEDLHGADLVVLAAEGDAGAIARAAPAAVVLVTGEGNVGERCRSVYTETLFPRARVVGVEDRARVGDIIEAILFERDEEHEVLAMREGDFGPTRARLGQGGIRALVEG